MRALTYTSSFIGLSLWALLLACLGLGDARILSKKEMKTRQLQAAERFSNLPRQQESAKGSGVKNITFHNPRARRKLKFILNIYNVMH